MKAAAVVDKRHVDVATMVEGRRSNATSVRGAGQVGRRQGEVRDGRLDRKAFRIRRVGVPGQIGE